ncbi:MAG TPA: immunoglobulin-like domain-containing protein [Myxococcaceae bacterium]
MLWTLVLTALACQGAPDPTAPEPTAAALRTQQQEANSVRKVLILGSSVSGGMQSLEAQAVQALPSSIPFQIDVVTPAQWRAMTAEQFMSYRALIIGDAACTSGEAAFQAAIDTRSTWGAVVDGNIIIIGSNPASNSLDPSYDQIVMSGVEFAVGRSRYTGMYISLGCAYQNAAPNTTVQLLSPFGDFKVAGLGCAPSGHVFSQRPATFTQSLWDGLLAGADGCSARSVFTAYPDHDFSIAALAVDESGSMPGAWPYFDYDWFEYFSGTPYILTRGAESNGLGCGGDAGNIPSGEECDLGDGTNGIPYPIMNPSCSWTCKLDWCGDGVVQGHLGEECDNGRSNGRDLSGNIVNGMCSQLCRIVNIPAPAGNAPVARCKNATVRVTNACGAVASIDDGSYDVDGDLVGCTQHPAGPYGMGNTTVTLTCSDQLGKVSSCSGTVSIQDGVVPTLSLNGSATVALQCNVDTYTEQGATANDMCSGPITPTVSGTVNNKVPAVYTVTYRAADTATPTPNVAQATRTVTVSDTLKPTLTLSGAATQTVECSATASYVDPGASASDVCAGTLTSAIVKSGAVNVKVPGSYSLTYDVSDPSGNAADRKTRAVAVQDTRAPVLNVAPYSNVDVECGDPSFAHPPVAITDTCFTTGPFTVPVPSRTVNPYLLGGQSVTYTARDPANNTGTSGPRTFTVRDTLQPTLTLLGASRMVLECGDQFTDPSARAHDQCFGDLTANVIVTGSVNSRAPGSYTQTYSVTDGRTPAVTASRLVAVQDTLAPVVTILGSPTASVECGAAYADPGASAADRCSGVLAVVPSAAVNPGVPGTYHITYSATDPSGNVGTSSSRRTVTVQDTLPPVLTLMGPASLGMECGTPFNDPGASANDQCAGPLPLAVTGSVNPMQPGSYTLNYMARDPSGRSASANRAVTVSDTLPPDLTVLGPAQISYECGSPYVDPGARASDACAGDLTAAIVAESAGNPSQPGTFHITYRVSDPSGHTRVAANARTVMVNDNEPPVLVLNGPATMGVECGMPFNDPGAMANDACFGDLSASIVMSGSVNTASPGQYAVVYNVTDPAGLAAPAVSRTVNVSDTLAPSIHLVGPVDITYECGTAYADPGAIASDVCAGNLTAQLVATSTPLPGQPGAVSISYSVTDPSGNTATSAVSRTVRMVDQEAPVVTLLGPASGNTECGTPYVDPGATANDACMGPLPVMVNGMVDHFSVGAYTLRYTAMDMVGLSGSQTRVVTVSDTQGPVVTVNGPLNQTIECGGAYLDPGATATDACAGPLAVVSSSAVNPNAPGSYTVTYSATDPSGNTGVAAASRTVTVQDNAPPVLVLNGPAVQRLECGTAYVDPGARAVDACFGDLSDQIGVSGQVNSAVPGSYTLSYSVVDASGLGASASRTVSVQDTLGPQIQMLPGPSVLTCNSPPYVDPGATAVDLCAGDLTPQITATSNLDQSRPGQYTVTYRVTDSAGNASTAIRHLTVTGGSLHLSDYNLFLLEDYTGGHDVLGKVAAGGNITMQDFSVGAGLPASDTSRTLVAGGNLTLSRGGVWGDAFYGGSYSGDGTVVQHRGTLAQGTPIDFAARFAELRSMSAGLSGQPANGTTRLEPWGGILLRGTQPGMNVFHVNASAFTGAKLLSIEAPAGSLVVVNIHGASATFTGFGHSFSGGIDQHGVLYNFVDATAINAHGYGFWGTVLAPYAHINFNNGSWDGGIYAVSLTGNAEGHINALHDRGFCQ